MSTSLLIPENPLVLLPSLAVLIGVEEAIVAQQIHFCLSGQRSGVEKEGEKWIYNTYEEWQEFHFPFWSIATIQRLFDALEEMSIVVSAQFDGRDNRRKYYRLNRGMVAKLTLENMHEQLKAAEHSKLIRTGERSKLTRSERINLLSSCAPASNSTETTTETTSPLPPKGDEATSESSSLKLLKKEKSNLPTSPTAIRVSTLFGRKLTTEWQDKEIRAFKKLKIDLDDLALLETYYAFERKKEGEGRHRRDLGTFLNNYLGELDRAREWRKNPKVNEKQKPSNGSTDRNAGTLNAGQSHKYANHQSAPSSSFDVSGMFDDEVS